MYKYKAYPLSNRTIANFAKFIRKNCGYTDTEPVDILRILEKELPKLLYSFDYRILEKEDMRLDCHAYTDIESNTIFIREDIYERARKGEGRDRFTIAHEIGHCLLHNKRMGLLTRVYGNEKIKPYEDIEWQADAFAGEFLCPSSAIKNMSIDNISQYYQVSNNAAIAQKNKSLRGY